MRTGAEEALRIERAACWTTGAAALGPAAEPSAWAAVGAVTAAAGLALHGRMAERVPPAGDAGWVYASLGVGGVAGWAAAAFGAPAVLDTSAELAMLAVAARAAWVATSRTALRPRAALCAGGTAVPIATGTSRPDWEASVADRVDARTFHRRYVLVTNEDGARGTQRLVSGRTVSGVVRWQPTGERPSPAATERPGGHRGDDRSGTRTRNRSKSNAPGCKSRRRTRRSR